jgi:glycosyltransferase involved in cell wall biosynthesis
VAIQFLSRGPIAQVSGGYLYNRYLIEHLRDAGAEVTYHATPPDVDAFRDTDVVVVDSLVLANLATRLLLTPARLLLLLHVAPSPTEPKAVLRALYRRARVVVTGQSTLHLLRSELADAIEAVKIEPGVPEYWRQKTRYARRAHKLLCAASYLPGKGIARLIDVVTALAGLPWALTVHGNRDFDPRYFRALSQRVRASGLDQRIELLGPIPHRAINQRMIGADLLVHLSTQESYSMVTAEAIACRLPVLSYRTGNCDTFRRSGLVRYVDDDGCADVSALAELVQDEAAYGRLRVDGRWRVRTCQDVGREFLDCLEHD